MHKVPTIKEISLIGVSNFTVYLQNKTESKESLIKEDKNTSVDDTVVRKWRMRWYKYCRFQGGACARPGPHAALLYDALRLWAAQLQRLFREQPKALYNLHDPGLLRYIFCMKNKIVLTKPKFFYTYTVRSNLSADLSVHQCIYYKTQYYNC